MSGFVATFADGAKHHVREAGGSLAAWEAAFNATGREPVAVEAVPYPFCWDPLNCAGNGYCRKSPACNN